MLTEHDRKYLENKHRGGSNNAKGNCYENLYAIYKIAILLKNYPNIDGTYLSSQIKDAFVDDFLISYNSGKFDYYQIKNVESLSWQTGTFHTLEYDFKRQKELLEDNGAQFALFLVYSNEESSVSQIPDSISNCTQIEYFPYFNNLNRLLLESLEFKNAIVDISAYNSPRIDQLLSLATILLGVWDSSTKTNRSLTQIIQDIRYLPLSGNNFIFDEELQINERARSIYNKIANFGYRTEGNTFYWSYKTNMTGGIQKMAYSNFEKQVLIKKPADFNELESLM